MGNCNIIYIYSPVDADDRCFRFALIGRTRNPLCSLRCIIIVIRIIYCYCTNNGAVLSYYALLRVCPATVFVRQFLSGPKTLCFPGRHFNNKHSRRRRL